MPRAQAHQTGSHASRRPSSTLLCAEHLTSCALHRPDLCEPIFITLPNATTARDLSPSRPARGRAPTETSPVTTSAGCSA
eukprot:scaffold11167_cov63-Phaeocystis_antarctica.AAC.1